MCPEIVTIGPFTIYSYGLMLASGFLIANYFLTVELRRRRLNPDLAGKITVLALAGGVVGAKILFLLENWDAFNADPIGMAFSPSGLTFYGGFLVAMGAIAYYVKSKKIPFLRIADAVAPGLLLGDGVARLGCHFSGDGDYGIPTSLPWGTIYASGTYKPTRALADYFSRNPEAAETWNYEELASQVVNRDGFGPITQFDLSTTLHPTPVYELLLCGLLFLLLWRFRTRIRPEGRMFMLYMAFAGTERFLVEFIRLNPRILLGLSEAQIIAIVLIAVGSAGWFLLGRRLWDSEGKDQSI
jgi:phosphatidylglycerol:prolipoprotein diacylglycerol transferase